MTNQEKLASIKQMQTEAESALTDPAIADSPTYQVELRDTIALCKKQYDNLLRSGIRFSYQ